ncbi:MAG: CotH kinase family protein, partial [Bacteroidales bacterium]|nr:CotH kinase family protein [Bacteroidales bacterium]
MKRLIVFVFATLISFGVFAQTNDLYDIETIQEIRISFEYPDWDYMLDTSKQGSEGFIMASSVVINGISFDSVGVKYKGNSSYSEHNAKNPLHTELDTYKSQDYQGYKDIKLNNGFKDPSFVREVLSYSFLQNYLNVSKANYAKLYINEDYIGLFANPESVTKTFVEGRFGSKSNTFFKCNPVYSSGPDNMPNLKYKGIDSTLYYDSYELKSDYGWQDLIDLCYTIENNTAEIESYININEVLWMLAFDNLFVNLDSYIGAMAQNYYLYMDDYGVFRPIVWDLNENFGTFVNSGTGPPYSTTEQKQQMSHVLHIGDANWPLISKILSKARYKKMYLAHYYTLLEEVVGNNYYYDYGLYLQNLISDEVDADPNKFYTFSDFETNLSSDVGIPPMGSVSGIQNLMEGRDTYLSTLLDFGFISPEISDIQFSNDSPELYSDIYITSSVTNNNGGDVILYYRNSLYAPFIPIQMYDDGLSGDGTAGDNVYGVSLEIISLSTDFYIYAENDDIGIFSPRRAQKEYHTIEANLGILEGDNLIINEFMASNNATAADELGLFPDWIELYNRSEQEINLNGIFLSDSYDNLQKWAFPDTTIQPGSFLIVWADNTDGINGLHTSFALSSQGEELCLSHESGYIIDSLSFGEQNEDLSMQRCIDNENSFFLAIPTFNQPNTCVSELNVDGLVINEFLASNEDGEVDNYDDNDDWIELKNISASTIALNDLFLSDSYANP